MDCINHWLWQSYTLDMYGWFCIPFIPPLVEKVESSPTHIFQSELAIIQCNSLSRFNLTRPIWIVKCFAVQFFTAARNQYNIIAATGRYVCCCARAPSNNNRQPNLTARPSEQRHWYWKGKCKCSTTTTTTTTKYSGAVFIIKVNQVGRWFWYWFKSQNNGTGENSDIIKEDFSLPVREIFDRLILSTGVVGCIATRPVSCNCR